MESIVRFRQVKPTLISKHLTTIFSKVTLTIANGEKDASLRISDQGGGIHRKSIKQIWTYAYTTAENEGMAATDLPKMAGYGYGLPLSRLYARYFGTRFSFFLSVSTHLLSGFSQTFNGVFFSNFSGGDLHLMSLDGYGTDCFLFLPKLAAIEDLPTFSHSDKYLLDDTCR